MNPNPFTFRIPANHRSFLQKKSPALCWIWKIINPNTLFWQCSNLKALTTFASPNSSIIIGKHELAAGLEIREIYITDSLHWIGWFILFGKGQFAHTSREEENWLTKPFSDHMPTDATAQGSNIRKAPPSWRVDAKLFAGDAKLRASSLKKHLKRNGETGCLDIIRKHFDPLSRTTY